MKEDIREGVLVFITNEKRDVFYIQQKDETYWIKEYRLKYSLFGGGVEKGENSDVALKRELFEELEPEVAELIFQRSKKIFETEFIDILGEECRHFLYESIMTDKELNFILSSSIREGKKGILIKKQELNEPDFFREVWKLLQQYLLNCERNTPLNNELVYNFNFQN